MTRAAGSPPATPEPPRRDGPRVGRHARIAGAVALAVVLVAAVAGLSRLPYTAEDGAGSVLRLSWRFRGSERTCRRLSPSELEELPVHMRREEVCEDRVPPYRLRVRVDGAPVVDRVVRTAGARSDRPLYVFEETGLQAGRHLLEVSFERSGEPGEEAGGEGPAPLVLRESVEVGPGEIVLVTYDDAAGRLRLRRNGATR